MTKLVENEKRKSVTVIEVLITVILSAIIVVMILIFAEANIFHYTANMDADIASESLLTEVLYNNGFLLPDTWCSSTTLRIISVPNFAAIIYPLTGFDSNLATGIVCTISMMIMLLLFFVYLMHIGLGVNSSLVAIIVLFLLTSPSDESQRMIFLYASYYVSHVITMLIVLIIYSHFIEDDKLKIFPLMGSLIISLINGMQGLHAFLFCWFPIFLIEVLRLIIIVLMKKKPTNYAVILWAAFMNAITLIVTKITNANSVGASRNIRHALDKFVDKVWPAVFKTLSFERMPTLIAVLVVVSAVGYILTIIQTIKTDSWKVWSILAFMTGFMVCVTLTTFTTFEVAERYYLMVVFSVAAGSALFASFMKNEITIVLTGLLIYGSVISMKDFYNGLIVNDRAKESALYAVSQWMEENDYTYGYSTFDFANPITVMKNNGVKVRPVTNMTDLRGLKWLSDSTWYPPSKDIAGETCYIFSDERQEDFDLFLNEKNPDVICVKRIDGFMIYVLDHDYTIWE